VPPRGGSSSWQPLLVREARTRARAAARLVADELAEGELLRDGADCSLAGGLAGLAVMYGYLARAWPGSGYDRLASRYLNRALRALGEVRLSAALYEGFTGVAWAAAHLSALGVDQDCDRGLGRIDVALRDYVGRSPWRHGFDLTSGLVGLGVYALERLPEPAAYEILELTVARLDEIAERSPAGVTWHTPTGRLRPDERERFPNGYYDLGLAHGVPGVIGLLGGACAHGVAIEQARPLLKGAVRWLLAQASVTEERGSRFAYRVAPDVPAGSTPARSAWCYGEPGIATTLLCAARAVGATEWERQAIEIAHRAARRPVEETGVLDAGLCHGAAGLGQIFNRLAQATGDGLLADAARRWLAHALDLREPGSGIAGFVSPAVDTGDGERRDADPALLTGAPGIALALLAASTDLEPAWERVLLLSTAVPRSPR